MVCTAPISPTMESFQISNAPLLPLICAPGSRVLITISARTPRIALFKIISVFAVVPSQLMVWPELISKPSKVTGAVPAIFIDAVSLQGINQVPVPLMMPPLMLKISGNTRFWALLKVPPFRFKVTGNAVRSTGVFTSSVAAGSTLNSPSKITPLKNGFKT